MPLIPQSFIDDLRSRLKMSDVAGRSLKLRRAGKDFISIDDPSLTFSDEKGIFHDFGKSQKSGDIFEFVMWQANCTFEAAVQDLASMAGLRVPGGEASNRPLPAARSAAPHGDADRPAPTGRGSNITATYDYKDSEGRLVYQVARMEWVADGKKKKTFLQRRPAPKSMGGWLIGLSAGDYIKGRNGDWYVATEERRENWPGQPVRSVNEGVAHGLFNLPDLLNEREEGDDARIVMMPEGEKDCQTLTAWGFLAITNSGGAKNWRPEHAELLRDMDVVILLDNDAAGRARGQLVGASLRGIAKRVRMLDWRHHWANCPEKADVTDWREFGAGSADKLYGVIDKLPEWSPQRPESVFSAVPFNEIDKPAREFEWLIKKILTRGETSVWFGQPGCVDGDAMVTINRGGNGRRMKLSDVVHCFNGTAPKGRSGRKWRHNIPTMIRCYVGGELRLRQVLAAYPKGIKPVLRLALHDGKAVRVTADHEILTRRGWLRADALCVGDDVMISGPQIPTYAHKQKSLPLMQKRAGRYLDKKGYWWVIGAGLKLHPHFGGKTCSAYDLPEHRLVAEARANRLTLDQWLAVIAVGAFTDAHVFLTREQHVHHRDEDTTNNEPDNLVVMTQSEHSTHHKFRQHLPAFNPGYSKVRSILRDGATEVFDLTVAEAHNFVANDIVVHNCGKSFLLTDAGLAVACGDEWMGFKTRKGLVVYQAGEGGMGLKKRLRAWRNHHQIPSDKALPFVLLPTPVNLFMGEDDADKLISEVKLWAAYYDIPLELLVIDTFSAASTGADENLSKDVSPVLARCRRIAMELGCHVALVHHTPKGGGSPRGWSGFTGNVENVIEVIRHDNRTDTEYGATGNSVIRDVREFVVRKQKDGEDGFGREFVLKQVVLGEDVDGDPVTSCVVTRTNNAAATETPSFVPKGFKVLPPNALALMRALNMAIERLGRKPPSDIKAPEGVKCVTVGDWQQIRRETLYAGPDADDPDGKKFAAKIKKQIERTYDGGLWTDKQQLIGKEREWVWRTDTLIHTIDRPRFDNNAASVAMTLAPDEDPDDIADLLSRGSDYYTR